MPPRLSLPLAASLVFVLSFDPLYPWVGDAMIAVAVAPIVLWAHAFGRAGGVTAGLVHVTINYVLLESEGRWPPPLTPGLPLLFASVVLVGIGLLAGYFGQARMRIDAEIVSRRKTEQDLRTALREVRTLRGMLPICSKCKKIRSENDTWVPVELFIQERSEASFTHGICPSCAHQLEAD